MAISRAHETQGLIAALPAPSLRAIVWTFAGCDFFAITVQAIGEVWVII